MSVKVIKSCINPRIYPLGRVDPLGRSLRNSLVLVCHYSWKELDVETKHWCGVRWVHQVGALYKLPKHLRKHLVKRKYSQFQKKLRGDL